MDYDETAYVGATTKPLLNIKPAIYDDLQKIEYQVISGMEFASVDINTGVVRGIAPGEAIIRVTIVDVSGHTFAARCSVTVRSYDLYPSDFNWDAYGVKGVDYEIVQDDDTVIAVEDYNKYVNWKARLLTNGKGPLVSLKDGEIDVFLVGGGGNGRLNGGGGGYTKTVKRINLTLGNQYSITIGGACSTTTAFGYSASGGLTGGEAANAGSGAGGSGGGNAYGGSGGSDGSDGGRGELNGSWYSGGVGQHSTTREFGEPNGKLYAGGGAGCSGQPGAGGGGASGVGNTRGGDGAPNTGGGGGGGLVNYSGVGGTGGSGIVVIRNARFTDSSQTSTSTARMNSSITTLNRMKNITSVAWTNKLFFWKTLKPF